MKKKNINHNNRTDIYVALMKQSVIHKLSKKVVRKRIRLIYETNNNKYNIKGSSDYPVKLNYSIYKDISES